MCPSFTRGVVEALVQDNGRAAHSRNEHSEASDGAYFVPCAGTTDRGLVRLHSVTGRSLLVRMCVSHARVPITLVNLDTRVAELITNTRLAFTMEIYIIFYRTLKYS